MFLLICLYSLYLIQAFPLCHNLLQAQELRSRMKALLMGKQEEYVVEVKGPGQVG